MNIYKDICDKQIKLKGMLNVYSGFIKIDFNEFKKVLDNENIEFTKKIIHELIEGKVILIKSAFSEEFVNNLKKEVKNFWKKNPNTYN